MIVNIGERKEKTAWNKKPLNATTRVNPLDLVGLSTSAPFLLSALCVVRHNIYYVLVYKNLVYLRDGKLGERGF